MKYVKKPIAVEAWKISQFDSDVPTWVTEALESNTVWFDDSVLSVRTLEGVMTSESGNYLIQGVRGELYPCECEIFEETYEPFSEEQS